MPLINVPAGTLCKLTCLDYADHRYVYKKIGPMSDKPKRQEVIAILCKALPQDIAKVSDKYTKLQCAIDKFNPRLETIGKYIIGNFYYESSSSGSHYFQALVINATGLEEQDQDFYTFLSKAFKLPVVQATPLYKLGFRSGQMSPELFRYLIISTFLCFGQLCVYNPYENSTLEEKTVSRLMKEQRVGSKKAEVISRIIYNFFNEVPFDTDPNRSDRAPLIRENLNVGRGNLQRLLLSTFAEIRNEVLVKQKEVVSGLKVLSSFPYANELQMSDNVKDFTNRIQTLRQPSELFQCTNEQLETVRGLL